MDRVLIENQGDGWWDITRQVLRGAIVGRRDAEFDSRRARMLVVRLNRPVPVDSGEHVWDVVLSDHEGVRELVSYSRPVYPLREGHESAFYLGFESIFRGIKATVYFLGQADDSTESQVEVGDDIVLEAGDRPAWFSLQSVLVGRVVASPQRRLATAGQTLVLQLRDRVHRDGAATAHLLVEWAPEQAGHARRAQVWPLDPSVELNDPRMLDAAAVWESAGVTAYLVPLLAR